jgi:hypothetical protein
MTNKTQVTELEAGALHALLAQVLEIGLRQQLLSGEIDNALVRNVIAYLNNNGITVSPAANKRMESLAHLLGTIDLDLPPSIY